MAIASEILSLRRDQSSSVKNLIGLLDFQGRLPGSLYQQYAVQQAADTVLLNVAVHAAQAAQDFAPTRGTRQAIRSLFRIRHGSDKTTSSQRLRRAFA